MQSFSSRFSFSFCKFLSLSSTRAEFTFAQTADAPRVFIWQRCRADSAHARVHSHVLAVTALTHARTSSRSSCPPGAWIVRPIRGFPLTGGCSTFGALDYLRPFPVGSCNLRPVIPIPIPISSTRIRVSLFREIFAFLLALNRDASFHVLLFSEELTRSLFPFFLPLFLSSQRVDFVESCKQRKAFSTVTSGERDSFENRELQACSKTEKL